MRPIATDNPVAWCVSLFVTKLSCLKAVERIKVLFEAETLWYPKHIVLDGGHNPVYGEVEVKKKNFAHC